MKFNDTRLGVDKPEIPYEQTVLSLLASVPIKTRADFSNDDSRFEFSTLSLLNNGLTQIISELPDTDPQSYTASMRAWLLYEAITEKIPHRAKHDQLRDGMPLLLKAAISTVAFVEAEKAKQAQSPQVGPHPASTWDRDSGKPFTLSRGPNGWVQGTSPAPR